MKTFEIEYEERWIQRFLRRVEVVANSLEEACSIIESGDTLSNSLLLDEELEPEYLERVVVNHQENE